MFKNIHKTYLRVAVFVFDVWRRVTGRGNGRERERELE